MGLLNFHPLDQRLPLLDRRQFARAVEAQHLQRRHTKWLRARRFGCLRVLGHCHAIVERSLTKIGAFFHSPLSFASATVTFGNWNKNALTLSSASFFCASPNAALYASRLGADVTFS